MPSALPQYRTLIKAWLATAADAATWTDAIVDEGLRHALVEFSAAYPPVETTLTLAAGGRNQDLATVPDLLDIVALAWPWLSDDDPFLPCRWRRRGATGVTLESGPAPSAGQKLRVRYYKRYAVQTLEGAAATTVPDNREHLLVIGAAAHALLLRVRQLSENPAIPATAASVLQAVAATWLAQFREGLTRVAFGDGIVAWGNIGL